MTEYVLCVEYMGVMRLLLEKREEVFTFSCQPTAEILLSAISQRYGDKIARECRKQLFVLYQAEQDCGRIIDSHELLANDSLIRIVSMVTGG